MKTNNFTRGVLALLLFILAACQAPGNTPTATAIYPAPETETATVVAKSTSTAMASATKEPEAPAGQVAYAHVEALSDGIGPRVAGTEKESETVQYIVLQLERLGYVSEVRPFHVKVKGKNITSANIVALKPGMSSQEIIVGAHYDSAKIGKGADDNATGVAVILEVARRLRERDTPYTIRFLFFGAEELEMQGSQSYVDSMTGDQIQNTLAMINLDCVGVGDIAYVYGDEGEKGILRDWALRFAQEHNLPLQTQPGDSTYPAGTTGDWSDHVPFKAAGIPYTYFEATNWTLGEGGWAQVSKEYGEAGEILHTKYDTLEYINKTFPGRMQEKLSLFVTVLEGILTEYEAAQ